MSTLRLALLFGGVSGEHEVSCWSAHSIFTNLDRSRYDVILIGVTKEGCWYRQPVSAKIERVEVDPSQEISIFPGRGLAVQGKPLPIDVVFPILHGVRGEDGRLQGLLEWAGLAYCGAGVLASALGMDKAAAKRLWQAQGLPVVPWLSFHKRDLHQDEAKQRAFDKASAQLGPSLFVKPSNSGSSVGVSHVKDFSQFVRSVETALTIDQEVLVEQAVSAREIEVAVIGTASVQAFGPGEIEPTHEFYDYDAKYTDPNGAAFNIPAKLDAALNAKVLDLAVQAYQSLGTRGFARVDLFVSKLDNSLWINEINTLPGFTAISMFPRMAMTQGRTYSQVLDAIIEQALLS